MELKFTQEWLNRSTLVFDDRMVAAGMVTDVSKIEEYAANTLRDFAKHPAAIEIRRRGWLEGFLEGGKNAVDDIARALERLILSDQKAFANAPMFKATGRVSAIDWERTLATRIWIDHVSRLALDNKIPAFRLDQLGAESLVELVQLSCRKDGPLRARDWLEARGIYLMVGPQLPSMKLDGAAAMLATGNPVIALSLRFDRIDSFWFTLMHEIGHVIRHLSKRSDDVFLDDLEHVDSHDEKEAQANAFARDTLIPRDLWRRSEAFRMKNTKGVVDLADRLGISPAIVAGRLRYEANNYTIFSDLVEEGSVRELFGY